MKKKPTTILLGLFLTASAAVAGDKTVVVPPVPVEDPKTFCDVFDLGKIYEGDGVIQEFNLIGRYHGQWHNADGSRGHDAGWENRRFRFGFDMEFLDHFAFEFQFNINRDNNFEGRFFDSVEDIILEWEPNDSFSLELGKIRPKVTRELGTSSKRIKTIERSQLVNQVTPDKTGGIIATFNDVAGFQVQVGGFSGSVTDDWEVPDFDAGWGGYFSLAKDVSEATELRFDYFYSDLDPDNNALSSYENVFSLNSSSQWGRVGLVTDLIYAEGSSRGDAFGVVILPTYELTEKLELVGRYTYSTSSDDDGIRLQSRYERRAVETGGTRGDEYHAFYAGLNYYLCGDKLKLMNGIEYSTLEGASDVDTWTFFTGVRLYF